jgi:hypothetical protein
MKNKYLSSNYLYILQKYSLLVFAFLFLFVIFKNVVDTQYMRGAVAGSLSNKELDISNELTSYKTYDLYFDRTCKITGSLEDRKRVRWIPRLLELKAFSLAKEFSPAAPYYLYIWVMSAALFASMLFCLAIVSFNWQSTFLFFCPLLFIFSFPLSEINFSILEMLFISMGLFFSYKKKFIPYLLVLIAATLNRESGVLIAFVWIIFNFHQYTRLIMGLVIAFASLITANIDIIPCFFKLGFFLSVDHQEGQYTLRDVSLSLHEILRFIKVIFQNFLIFLIPAFLLFFNNSKRLYRVLLIYCLYFGVFLIFTPLLHISVRLVIIPYLVMLCIPFTKSNDQSIG